MKLPFFHRKPTPQAPTRRYDPEREEPAIRCSICTGEQVAGFRELPNGRFREVSLLLTPQDLEDFRNAYGITGEIKKFY